MQHSLHFLLPDNGKAPAQNQKDYYIYRIYFPLLIPADTLSSIEVYVHANQIYRLLRFRIFLFHPFQKELSEEMACLCHADLGIRYEVNHLTADFCL